MENQFTIHYRPGQQQNPRPINKQGTRLILDPIQSHGTLCDVRLGPRTDRDCCIHCKLNARKCICDLSGTIHLPFPVPWKHFIPTLTQLVPNNTLDPSTGRWRSPIELTPNLLPYYCSQVIVLKTTMRPYHYLNGTYKPHALTTIYDKILRIINRGPVDPQLQYTELYGAVNMLAHGGGGGGSDRGGTPPYEGIFGSLGSKTGEFREHLHGKRIDFTGRSVIISAGAGLRIDQVGIPREMARVLTVPERVHPANHAHLRRLIAQHQATTVQQPNHSFKVLPGSANLLAHNLKIGDIVHRHLRDGDYVIFGRQPTLHKGSMMAFDVRIVDGKAIQMCVDTTPCFNADFDGDCMWVFVPQTEEARAECAEVIHVRQNLFDVNHQPQFGLVQHALWTSYRLTDPNVLVSPEEYADGSLWASRAGAVTTQTTGMAYLSLAFPPDLCFESSEVTITNGQWVRGRATAKVVGTGGLLMAVLFKRKDGPLILERLRHLCCEWMKRHSFSLGLSDMVAPPAAAAADLDNAMADLDQWLRTHQPRNRVAEMVRAGAKGKLKDLVNITTMVPAPQVASKPLPVYYPNNRRFPTGGGGPIPTGFVHGLALPDIYGLACKARYDVSARALLTAKTGYLSRKLNNMFVACTYVADPTARSMATGLVLDDMGRVVTFTYPAATTGDAVGLEAASAIAAPLTQSVLDTFHCTGEGGNGSDDIRALLSLRRHQHCRWSVPFDREIALAVTALPALDTKPSYVQRFIHCFPDLAIQDPTKPVHRVTLSPTANRPFAAMVDWLLGNNLTEFVLSDDQYDNVYELQLPLPTTLPFHPTPWPFQQRRGTGTIEFTGGSLAEVVRYFDLSSIANVGVDDAWTIRQSLGIEASREYLYRKFTTAFPHVHHRHIGLLADIMTFRGTLNNTNYQGIALNTESTMGLACFERAQTVLVKAAVQHKQESRYHPLFQLVSGQRVTRATIQLLEEATPYTCYEYLPVG